jgi:predicted nucleic acid-binding protein
LLYVDTSAAAKLLLREAETDALVAYLSSAGRLLATSRIGVVELRRLGRRASSSPDRADAVAATLAVIEIDDTVERIAIVLDPSLRALDAIHLASALAAGDALDAFVCYDGRLAQAAAAAGLNVVAPQASAGSGGTR